MPHEQENGRGAVDSNTVATDGQVPDSDKANPTKQNKQQKQKQPKNHKQNRTSPSVR